MRLLLILLLFISNTCFAQFKSAKIGIDGLTCSMCSNSVERFLKQLDFVKEVKMDLNENVAEVNFIEGKKADMNALSKKVSDAGYSVRSLHAVFLFNNQKVKEGTTFTFENNTYLFLKAEEKILDKENTLQFIGKNFVSRKEYINWEANIRQYAPSGKPKKNFYYVIL
jgi:copper chaperone CopZ